MSESRHDRRLTKNPIRMPLPNAVNGDEIKYEQATIEDLTWIGGGNQSYTGIIQC